MNKFWVVFNFEFKKLIKSKGYIISLLITMIIIVCGMVFFNVISSEDEKKEDKKAVEKIKNEDIVLLHNETDISDTVVSRLINSKIKLVKKEDELKNTDYAFSLYLKKDNTIKLYISSDKKEQEYNRFLVKIHKYIKLRSMNVKDEDAINLIDNNQDYSSDIIKIYSKNKLDRNEIGSVLAYVFLYTLYIYVIMFQNMIVINIMNEKVSRTMEILITSAKPKYIFAGKVCGVIAASALNLAIVISTAAVALFVLNQGASEGFQLIFNNLSWGKVGISFVFIITTIWMYTILLAGVGSWVTRMEDTQQILAPIMWVFLITFFAVIGIANANPYGLLYTILQYFPITAPVAMLYKFNSFNIGYTEIIISLSIIIVFSVNLQKFMVKVFEKGCLNYSAIKLFSRKKKRKKI